jgi:hypothetical protein
MRDRGKFGLLDDTTKEEVMLKEATFGTNKVVTGFCLEHRASCPQLISSKPAKRH